MKRMSNFLFFLILVSFKIYASQNIEEIIKNSPTSGKFPDASGAILFSSHTFRLEEGFINEEYLRVLKVFTLTGREKFSDFRIPFDREKEKIELIMARTYKSDLTFVEVEKGAINDVTPLHLSGADVYSNLIQRVVSFPAVDPLKSLVIHYLKKGMNKEENIDGIVYFQADEPILKKELRIVIPKHKELKYKISGLSSDLKMEMSGEYKVYTMSVNNSPQIKEEEFMPPESKLYSKIIFSTYKDWKEATSSFASSFYKAVKISEDIKRFTEKLTEDCKSIDEKIKRIFSFVSREVKNVELDFGEGGYSIHSSDEVLHNRYGDWKDKTALLVSMMKVVGLDSYPVLTVRERIEPLKDIPTMKQFNVVLVAVPKGEDYIFLSPFANDSFFGYFLEGKDSEGLIVKPDKVEFVRVHFIEDLKSIARSEMVGEINERGDLKGKIFVEVSGIFDKIARKELKDKTEREREIFFKESINRLFEEGKTQRYKLSNLKDIFERANISQDFLAERFGVFQGNILLINIPGTPYSFSNLISYPRLAKRNYPFYIQDECEILSDFRLIIPREFKPIYLPEKIASKKDYGEFELITSFDKEKSEITIKKKILILKREIPVQDYEEFKSIMDTFGLAKNRLILLEKR